MAPKDSSNDLASLDALPPNSIQCVCKDKEPNKREVCGNKKAPVKKSPSFVKPTISSECKENGLEDYFIFWN
jgi:hypothetical protein